MLKPGNPNLPTTCPQGWQHGGGRREAAADEVSQPNNKPTPWSQTRTALVAFMGTRVNADAARLGGWPLQIMCRACGQWVPEHSFHVEHIIPWAQFRGLHLTREDDVLYINDLDNLTVLCGGCNVLKGTMALDEFMRQMAYPSPWPGLARLTANGDTSREGIEKYWHARDLADLVPRAGIHPSKISKANAR